MCSAKRIYYISAFLARCDQSNIGRNVEWALQKSLKGRRLSSEKCPFALLFSSFLLPRMETGCWKHNSHPWTMRWPRHLDVLQKWCRMIEGAWGYGLPISDLLTWHMFKPVLFWVSSEMKWNPIFWRVLLCEWKPQDLRKLGTHFPSAPCQCCLWHGLYLLC